MLFISNWKAFFITTIVIIVLTAYPKFIYAAFNEQMAVDPVSIALANTVTARPPGMAAVHFNPAGLSKLPPGKLKASGFSHVRLYRTLSTKEDDNFKGFMDTWGNPDSPDYGPFGWEPHNQEKGYYKDPLDGQSAQGIESPGLSHEIHQCADHGSRGAPRRRRGRRDGTSPPQAPWQ